MNNRKYPLARIVIVVFILFTIGALLGWSRYMPLEDIGVDCKLSQQFTSYTMPSGFYEPGAVVRHEFRIVNDTFSTVRFSSVRTSCTCTTAALTCRKVEPAAVTLLQMSLKLVDASGRRNARCVLIDDNGKYWVFTLTAISYPAMEFAQGGNHAFVSMGMLNPGEDGSGIVDVFTHADPNEEPPQIEVKDVPSEPLKIELQRLAVETLSDGFRRRHTQVLIQLPKQTASGLHKADVVIGCRSGCASRTANITAVWQVKSFYDVEPERISLGILDDVEAREVRRMVTVERGDGKRLNIISVRSSHPGITFEGPNRISTNRERITVVVHTTFFAGPVCGELLIATDAPVQSTIVVPVVGFR